MDKLISHPAFNLLIVGCEAAEAGPTPTIVAANQAAAELFGYAAPALSGRPLAEIFAAGLPPSWPTRAADITDGGFSLETEIVTVNQQRRRALLSIAALPVKAEFAGQYLLVVQAIDSGNDFLVMQRVIEQSASAMMITDAAGRIEYVNPKFSELTGYATAELLGQNPKMLQSGKIPRDYYQAMWDRLMATGEWQGELKNRHKSGREYWVYESVSAIKNSAGDITHFLAIEEDISQRKVVESALAESEERFRQMAELSGEWLWEQDPAGFYLYSSVAVSQILGFDQDQIIGKHYTELLTAQDKQTQTGYSSSQQSFKSLVNHYRHKDGHLVITESTGLPILSDSGELLKWRGVDRDITAKMQFQNALIESEKRTRLIIESSLNAIVLMDSYGIVTDWNQRAEKMFGWLAAEAIGKRLDEMIIPERFHEAHRHGLRSFLETGRGPILNRQIEHIGKRRDGSEFPVEISVSPLKLGNSYIFSGFIHDISGRKAAEQQIRQAQIDLAVAQNEIQIAQQIQANLAPAAAIKTADFEITGFCQPADQVGGDYYDYFYAGDAQFNIVIADVSGHSIGPALFMVETRSVLRVQANPNHGPAAVVGALNNFLFDDLNHADYFITLFYAQIDLAKGCLRYANAGHPPPMLFNAKCGEFVDLDADGLIVGIRKYVSYEERVLDLSDGDVVLFYTDGLLESENAAHEFFGLERAKAVLRENAGQEPQRIIDSLFDALRKFCQAERFNDDISLMVFKWR